MIKRIEFDETDNLKMENEIKKPSVKKFIEKLLIDLATENNLKSARITPLQKRQIENFELMLLEYIELNKGVE